MFDFLFIGRLSASQICKRFGDGLYPTVDEMTFEGHSLSTDKRDI